MDDVFAVKEPDTSICGAGEREGVRGKGEEGDLTTCI